MPALRRQHDRGDRPGDGPLASSDSTDIGPHYATTLAAWRRNFLSRREDVRRLGYPERFLRMWDYYLAYCEAGFAERYIGTVQMILAKPGWRGMP